MRGWGIKMQDCEKLFELKRSVTYNNHIYIERLLCAVWGAQ